MSGRIPNDLEDSEDRRSVGGHGNQHVRLRIAQVDRIETFCPALAALLLRAAAGVRARISSDSTLLQAITQLSNLLCVDWLIENIDADRPIAAAIQSPPESIIIGRVRLAVAAGRNSRMTRSDSVAVDLHAVVGSGVSL
jgi:hypothetical protein